MLPINSNMSSLGAMNALEKNRGPLETAMDRLASGKRINSAKDDAAGLAIALQYAVQLAGGEQGFRNVNDAVSVAQVADGAVSNVSDSLQRMRELAVQSANGSLSDSARSALQAEVSELQEEIGRTIGRGEFNGVNPLAQTSAVSFQAGSEAGDTLSLQGVDATTDLTNLGFDGIDISTAAGATAALGVLDSAVDYMSGVRGNLGAAMNRFDATIQELQNRNVNIAEAKSRVMDADYASETAELTRRQIQNQAGLAMLSQANVQPQGALGLLG